MFYIMPYKLGSESAKNIARSLGVLCIRGKKRLKRYATVINWGNSTVVPFSRWGNVKTINHPTAVAKASNKIASFLELTKAGVSTVPWTTNPAYAKSWVSETDVVMGRMVVNGSQGAGIKVITSDEVFPICPLYTKHIPKCHEYRVHVAFGEVIDFSKKKRRNDVVVNEYVRNYDNGWVFCRDGLTLPDVVAKQSIAAVKALGLDFGALDVLYKERDNKCYVLECNSAPGAEGTTLNKYIETFKKKVMHVS